MTSPITETPQLALNDGSTIPQLGFGVYRIEPDAAADAVSEALAAGYRHVDTARAYRNESGVGEAVRGLGEWAYVTTKYFEPGEDHGHDDALAAFEESAINLGLDRVDLYLVHWPTAAGEGYVASWTALTELQASEQSESGSGRVHSIGVSNFVPDHLARVVDATGVTPAVNQVELHPYFQQRELREVHAERGIATEAWGPLGQGGAVLEDPTLREIGAAHGKTVAQVVVRWHLQLGTVVIPKSETPARIRENIEVFDFALSADEMTAIEGLDRGERVGPDPATFVMPVGGYRRDRS